LQHVSFESLGSIEHWLQSKDYANVLSGFVAEPIRWIESYGWRALQPIEQEALYSCSGITWAA